MGQTDCQSLGEDSPAQQYLKDITLEENNFRLSIGLLPNIFKYSPLPLRSRGVGLPLAKTSRDFEEQDWRLLDVCLEVDEC